jgi:translation initiation factor 3 subunit F
MESTTKVTIRPHVLHAIIDSFERRNMDVERVIGTLMGNVDKGVIEVTNSFIVPHDEKDGNVSMDLEFGNSMCRLMKNVNQNEQPVGWYSTGCDVTEQSQIVHLDVYTQMVTSGRPVFVLVDTSLLSAGTDGDNTHIAVKAFISKAVGVPPRAKGTIFLRVPVSIEAMDGERCAVHLMQKGLFDGKRIAQVDTGIEHIYDLTSRLLEMLEKVLQFVDIAMSEGTGGDYKIGKMLAQVIHAVPTVDPEKWLNMLDNDANHNLMVSYLSCLLHSQLNMKETITNTI